MFKLVVDGVTIGFTEKPRFVRVKPETGVFVETTQDKADGVAYKSKVFNLFGHEIGGVEETVSVVPYDGGDDSKEIKNNADNLAEIEDAMCEADETNEAWKADIENALCEMDEGV